MREESKGSCLNRASLIYRASQIYPQLFSQALSLDRQIEGIKTQKETPFKTKSRLLTSRMAALILADFYTRYSIFL